MTPEELSEIKQDLARITPGEWYWREGVHTDNPKTSDAGGLHTRPEYPLLVNGEIKLNDNVLFPVGHLTGDPAWIRRFQGDVRSGKSPLALALDLYGREEDKEFIANAPKRIQALLTEIERLQSLIEEEDSSRDRPGR